MQAHYKPAHQFWYKVLQIKFNCKEEYASQWVEGIYQLHTWWGVGLGDMLLGILTGSSSSSLAGLTIWPSPASCRKTSNKAPEEVPMLLLLNLLADCSCMDFKCSCLAYKRMYKLQPGQLPLKTNVRYVKAKETTPSPLQFYALFPPQVLYHPWFFLSSFSFCACWPGFTYSISLKKSSVLYL